MDAGITAHADLPDQRQGDRRGDVGGAGAAAQKAAGGLSVSAGEGKTALRIRRLKLSGFKSFVEPAELRIEPGLTGVVGPERLRQVEPARSDPLDDGRIQPEVASRRRMDDVIFAGTATRPPRDFAEVSILLERDAADEGGAGESEVTRRIERGAGSAYRIDGRDVRAKDVVAAVRRRRDRRAFAGARQPGQDRRDHRGQAGRAAAAARGSGGHFRASRAPQGRRAEAARRPRPISRGSAKSSASRSSARRSSGGRRGRPSATASSPTRSAASRRGCSTRAGSRPSERRKPRPPKRKAAAEEVERIQQAIADAQARARARQ